MCRKKKYTQILKGYILRCQNVFSAYLWVIDKSQFFPACCLSSIWKCYIFMMNYSKLGTQRKRETILGFGSWLMSCFHVCEDTPDLMDAGPVGSHPDPPALSSLASLTELLSPYWGKVGSLKMQNLHTHVSAAWARSQVPCGPSFTHQMSGLPAVTAHPQKAIAGAT